MKSAGFRGEGFDLDDLRNRSFKFVFKRANTLSPLNRDVVEKVSQKFNFGLPTMALGIYLFHSTLEDQS